MAITPTIEQTIPLEGNTNLYIGTLAVTGTYTTGGVAVDASGNERFDALVVTSASGGFVARWDRDNQKLLFYVTKDPGNAGGADIVLQQLANAADHTGATGAVFFAFGQ